MDVDTHLELVALTEVLKALESLDAEARERIVRYVHAYFEMPTLDRYR